MLKRFFISFLGALAGLLVAGFLSFLIVVSMIAVAGAGSSNSVATLKKGSVMKIDFSGLVADRYQSGKLYERLLGDDNLAIGLNDLVAAIDGAATDKQIEGIYLECNGATAGLAQLQALREAFARFKESGKWIYAYGDNYTQGNYFLAAAADSLYVNPSGMIDIHGLSSTVMYFKDLLDKVGVKVQVVKVGTYKSAVEPFILSDMSEANREQMDCFLGNMWSNIASAIASDRNVDTTAVNRWADSFSFAAAADTYVKEKIADRLIYKHQIKDIIKVKTGSDKPNIIDFSDYLKLSKQTSSKGAKIAVLYASGDITEDGDDGIASNRLVPVIFKLAEKDDIDGLVLRVNSGGGSAYASEQIWEALQQFKQKTGKPFYVSMADYAASGGYYISCGADRIYAEPLTLTGSIGIFGLIPDAHELMSSKLGINTATVATNKGNFPNLINAMTPGQAAAMQSYVDRGYELFTSRCAEGRHIPVDSIKKIAEGRVWDGQSALRIGLVDKLGGLEMALADMAASINEGTGKEGYKVVEYPKIKIEWYDELLHLNATLEERAIKNRLGESAVYLKTLQSVKSMSPLQCRMELMEIH